MDIFFPNTFRERAAFKKSAIKCGFVELTVETTANVGILPADEKISTLLMAWRNIGNYLTKHPYNHDVGITVSWIGRCTLNLWFGREWIACTIENKTELIEQMMKVYPTAFITMHPYSWPYMFSIYRDPWMVDYLNLNFQRMSGPDLSPVLEPKDSEFIQQEGIPLLILRMVNMFDFRMVKLVKYMCLRLLLTWQDTNSTSSKTLRASLNAERYIDYARHIYLIAVCESNGFKDLHYTLETIQRVVHCDLKETWPLDMGIQSVAKGLQESNMTLTELLIEFLLKVPKLQFGNIFGAALAKYVNFITEYQLRNINRLSSTKLSRPIQEVYSKLVQMFIVHRESSEELINATSKLSEKIFLGLQNLTASKCAYELIKQRPHAQWHASKITLLLTIISEEVNIIQDYKYNDVQSTDELIEKEKEVAIYYRDLAQLFHKSPYLEQEAWLTTFSLHPCREFMNAVTRCGARNLRAIKKQAHRLKIIQAPESKTKTNDDVTYYLKQEYREKMYQEEIVPEVPDTMFDPRLHVCCTNIIENSEEVVSTPPIISSKDENKPMVNKKPQKKTNKSGPKKIEPKIKYVPKDIIPSNMCPEESESKQNKFSSPFKRGRPISAFGKNKRPRSRPAKHTKKTTSTYPGEKSDLAEEIFAAAAGAAENINSQTTETIQYPAFALMNSVTDTEELMKFTNYNEAYEQYTELNKILSGIKLNHTFYEDLLTLLIAPRYKRLTWAVSWKKLKKRCRVILTKDNKKRELVEQSMADANDRLTHLNIDYERYKDKPQIDYGTIEGGYECYDTDSDDDDFKTTEAFDKKTMEIPNAKNNVELVGSSNEDIQIKRKTQILTVGNKPYLKIENLDSSTSNLLNIIDSTHLSKPVYLNKPVYFVRNPLASPSSETAICLETGLENQESSQTSSRRSGEKTLTSSFFEEHNWHLITSEMTRDFQEQQNNTTQFASNSSLCRSFLKPEMTLNIPASIRQQLEQPTMFFKLQPKNESNSLPESCEREDNTFQNKPTELSTSVPFSPLKAKNYHNTLTSNQNEPALPSAERFSPKLFEDMPEDLTMPKLSKKNIYKTNASLLNIPLNLTSRLVIEPDCKSVSTNEKPQNRFHQTVERRDRSLTKINSRKRLAKKDKMYRHLRKEEPDNIEVESSNIQQSINQDSLIIQPTPNLKSVRVFPHNKHSIAIRINPTAAVVFSSAAASYHRTPFLNVAQQEPNILHQLLAKEITPFKEIDAYFDKSTAVKSKEVSKCGDDSSSLYQQDVGANTVACSINTMMNSTLEVQKSNTQNLLPDIDVILKPNKSTGFKGSPSKSIISQSGPKKSATNGRKDLPKTLKSDLSQSFLIDLKDSKKKYEETYSSTLKALQDVKKKNPPISENIPTDVVIKSGSMFNSSVTDFEFKVPAPVEKPCFFMRKQKKVHAFASDWVKNITFNDRTAEIIGPVSRNGKFPESNILTKSIEKKSMLNQAEDGVEFKLTSYNVSTPPSSQSQSDDILYNKDIVFNKKLLDPHLKTYKNIKAPCKMQVTISNEAFSSGTNELFSGTSEESNLSNRMDASEKFTLPHINPQIKENHEITAFQLSVSNLLNKNVRSNSLIEHPPKRLIPSALASTSQNTIHAPRTYLGAELQTKNFSIQKNKKRIRPNIPSTKKLDQMFEWIEIVTKANREAVPESLDTPGTLLNLFSAQLMNQAKSIHFNYEYQREKAILNDRVDNEGANCEASILIASPGPSEDCVNLIKAFKNSTAFKGVDVSSNEISLTSSLAHEVLGTIFKFTLNESERHASCRGNHFDASDALDEFIRDRRDANSPTFYSPTLSLKHLRNGTLPDSVEYLKTSLEKFIPKPGRKRSSISGRLPIKKRIRKQQSIDNQNVTNDIQHALDQNVNNDIQHVFSEHFAESSIAYILKPTNSFENTTADSSQIKNIPKNVLIDELPEVEKPLVQFHLEQRSFDQLSADFSSASKYKDKNTFLNDGVLQSLREDNVLDICVTHQDNSEGIRRKEKYFDSHKAFNSELKKHSSQDPSGEENLKYCYTQPINNKLKKPNIKRNKKIPIKRMSIEKTSLAYHRFRRNTYDETKYIRKEETVTILNPEGKKTVEESSLLSEERISGHGKSTTCAIEDHLVDEEKYKKQIYKLNAPEIISSKKKKNVGEDIEEMETFKIEESLAETNKISVCNERKQLQLMALNIKKKDTLHQLVEKINEIENTYEKHNEPLIQEIKQCPIEIKEIMYPMNIPSEEEDKESTVKKRVVKPRISYVELDSDSDELSESRLKIPSLKINVPSTRSTRRILLNRSITKKNVPNKTSPKKPTRKHIMQKKNKALERSKRNPSSSLNDSDVEKPIINQLNKSKIDDSYAYYLPKKITEPINESDDDVPLTRIPKRRSSNKPIPRLITKNNTSKIQVRKKYRNAYSPKRPQNKISRSRTTTLNYFALFLSDSDEDEPIKSNRKGRTPDRLWTHSTVKRKVARESVKKISQQRKRRCSRIQIRQRESRNRLPKSKIPAVKMPVLTREDSDHDVEENIYECATVSTANETDEDACFDHQPKKRRQKVVKPMRIRCVSRRSVPTDVFTESSSCSSLATVKAGRELGCNSTSNASFPKKGRSLRGNTPEKSLFMTKSLESSSSSSPVMMNKRQFVAKSTSKPQVIRGHGIYVKTKQHHALKTNTFNGEPLTFMDKKAIHNHNCVNFQIRLQRLTATEAILCRKPCVRLDKNFIQNYFADKIFGYNEIIEPDGLINDNNVGDTK